MDPKTILKSNNLSFCRSIEPSEAALFGIVIGHPASTGDTINRAALVPVEVEQKTVRGTISNYVPPKATYNFENANLQTIEVAFLPPGCDRLAMTYSATFVPNSLAPYATNSLQVKKSFEELSKTYSEIGGYRHLAKRYLWNIVNGRALWRNSLMMFDKQVEIRMDGKLQASVDPGRFNLGGYPGDDGMKAVLTEPVFDMLTGAIAEALSGDGPVKVVEVLIHGRVGVNMQVYPSQEFLRGEQAEKLKRANGNFDVGKALAFTRVSYKGREVRQAVMHSQKVGNALRWIDEWHADAEHGAVPVDPYAALTLEATTLRPSTGSTNFYSFLNKPELVIKPMNSDNPDLEDAALAPAHYFMAMLIRGGLFGSKSEAAA